MKATLELFGGGQVTALRNTSKHDIGLFKKWKRRPFLIIKPGDATVLHLVKGVKAKAMRKR